MMELGQELAQYDEKMIYLVVTTADKYFKTSSDILKIFCNERGDYCIYLTFGKPYDILLRQFSADGIDVSKLFFLDSVTKKEEKPNNVLFAASPSSLTEISISLTSIVQLAPKEKTFVYIDSLTTMLLYNHQDILIRFIHVITTKLREWGVAGVLISVGSKDEQSLLAQISQFCDKTIELDGSGVMNK